jgi:hypothetical protein
MVATVSRGYVHDGALSRARACRGLTLKATPRTATQTDRQKTTLLSPSSSPRAMPGMGQQYALGSGRLNGSIAPTPDFPVLPADEEVRLVAAVSMHGSFLETESAGYERRLRRHDRCGTRGHPTGLAATEAVAIEFGCGRTSRDGGSGSHGWEIQRTSV